VDVVGFIPPGLPPRTIPWELYPLDQLIFSAIVICIVGYIVRAASLSLPLSLCGAHAEQEHISVAKMWAAHHKYEVDANQEFLALGIANFVGSFLHAYPMCGTVGRAAVAQAGGARSGVASLLTGLVYSSLSLSLCLFLFLCMC
jgi:MFS superfamily sulfate permease-like transporter